MCEHFATRPGPDTLLRCNPPAEAMTWHISQELLVTFQVFLCHPAVTFFLGLPKPKRIHTSRARTYIFGPWLWLISLIEVEVPVQRLQPALIEIFLPSLSLAYISLCFLLLLGFLRLVLIFRVSDTSCSIYILPSRDPHKATAQPKLANRPRRLDLC